MPEDRGADLFEASLMLLAGSTPAHRVRDSWAAVGASAGFPLRAEFELRPAADRFAAVMASMPDARCWTRRRVAGIRRRYETFVVDVDAAEPSIVVGRLRAEWTHNVGLLLGGPDPADVALRLRAAAVWRSALLTAAPRVTSAGLRLRERDRTSVRLLLRAAQLLGVACKTRPASGSQLIQVQGPGVLTLLSTVTHGG